MGVYRRHRQAIPAARGWRPSASGTGVLAAVAALVVPAKAQPGAAPDPQDENLWPTEGMRHDWILQRYVDPCKTIDMSEGAQQTWKVIPGMIPFCYRITTNEFNAPCRSLCTVRAFCARGSNTGVKLQYYEGDNCISKETKILDFADHLTWPKLSNMLQGQCIMRTAVSRYGKADGHYEKFATTTWDIGVEFPNCLGYDFETASAGVVNLAPEDQPMTLKLYEDELCTVERPALDPAANITNKGGPKWHEQTWMSVLRTIDVTKRKAHHRHCWEIQAGAPPLLLTGAFKLKCGQLMDGRMGMHVEMYDDNECAGEVTKEEVFWMGMHYGELMSSTSDVEELRTWFRGACIPHSDGLWWKFDRDMFHEDYPDCYQLAMDENIRIRRPVMTDVYYKGDVNTVRKARTASHAGRSAALDTALLLLLPLLVAASSSA